MKIVAGIQARMGSTRFPGKSMADLCGKPVVGHVIDRAKLLDVDDVVLLTTMAQEDNCLIWLAVDSGISWMRDNFIKLECFNWYVQLAKGFEADYVVRICGDAPFFDYKLANQLIAFLRLNSETQYDYLSIKIGDTWGIMHKSGIAVEIIGVSYLMKSMEHVTWGLHETLKSRFIRIDADNCNWKCSVDTPEDLEVCKYIYRVLDRPPASYREIDANMPDRYRVQEVTQQYK